PPGAGPRPAPQRTLADLDRLVADTRATGMPVAVEVNGPLDGLPAAVSREGYRIVQEGLTNAARHAGGAPVTLRLDVPEGILEIELVNALAGGRAVTRSGRGRGGRGLPGMRERVTLLGGSMSAGPDGTTWRVAVRLPLSDAAGGRRS
ncbi:sensor histidine kinase, partial [Micromonospora zhanjiangensis]